MCKQPTVLQIEMKEIGISKNFGHRKRVPPPAPFFVPTPPIPSKDLVNLVIV